MLESRFAMVVAWGPDFRFLYNDRYRPVLGSKHPALGHACCDIFPEVWPVIGPEFERVRRGEAFAIDDWYLPLERNGYPENCWFTLSYSPIRDESGGVGGLLAVVAETTGRVDGERRLATLGGWRKRAATRDLRRPGVRRRGGRVRAESDRRALRLVPYLTNPDGLTARLVAATGNAADHPAATPLLTIGPDDHAWPCQTALTIGQPEIAARPRAPLLDRPLPGGAYPGRKQYVN